MGNCNPLLVDLEFKDMLALILVWIVLWVGPEFLGDDLDIENDDDGDDNAGDFEH